MNITVNCLKNTITMDKIPIGSFAKIINTEVGTQEYIGMVVFRVNLEITIAIHKRKCTVPTVPYWCDTLFSGKKFTVELIPEGSSIYIEV